jgi:hypothetical protein
VVFGVRLGWEKEMMIGASSRSVLPALPIFFESVGRRWIGVALVEVSDFLGGIG